MTHEPAPASRRCDAVGWVLLAAAAIPVAYVVLETVRLVTGPAPSDLAPQGNELEVSTYLRLYYLLQVVGPDRVLVLPVLALAAVAWRGRARSVRTAAAAVAALMALESVEVLALVGYVLVGHEPSGSPVSFNSGADLVSLFPSLAAAVLLLCLSALLVRVLAAEAPPPPAQPGPAPDGTPTAPAAEPAPRGLPPDPYAAYRPPAPGAPKT